MKQVFGVKPQNLMLKPAANVNEVTFPTKTGATFKFFNFEFGRKFALII